MTGCVSKTLIISFSSHADYLWIIVCSFTLPLAGFCKDLSQYTTELAHAPHMSFQYFAGSYRSEKAPGVQPKADYLIMLGNQGRANDLYLEAFLHNICERGWKRVFYIPGSLEAIGGDYENVMEALHKIQKDIPKLTVLVNEAYDLEEEGIRVYGTPLFTDFAHEHKYNSDTSEDVPEALRTSLPYNIHTRLTNRAFGYETDSPVEGEDMIIGHDGENPQLSLPVTALWWECKYEEAVAKLMAAISQAYEDDMAFIVATHWQPTVLLDPSLPSGEERAVDTQSLRYSVNHLPLRTFARIYSDRAFLWFYGTALYHGAATTGVPAIDKVIRFYGTPNEYLPAVNAHIVDLVTFPAPSPAPEDLGE